MKSRGGTHLSFNIVSSRRSKFGRVISPGSDLNWPPTTCNLTPLNFFVWGYLKDHVYDDKPATIQALKMGQLSKLKAESLYNASALTKIWIVTAI